MPGNEKVTKEAKEAIADVMSAILKQSHVEDFDLLQRSMSAEEIGEIVCLAKEGDIEQVHLRMTSDSERIFEALVKAFITENCNAEFIVTNFSMIYYTLCGLFEKYEGAPCSADKASVIAHKAYRHFHSGERISFSKQ